jgi:hypothetical protein
MSEWQKKGYEAWIERWVARGCTPTARDCPARWLRPESAERAEFISGWNKAKTEHSGAALQESRDV